MDSQSESLIQIREATKTAIQYNLETVANFWKDIQITEVHIESGTRTKRNFEDLGFDPKVYSVTFAYNGYQIKVDYWRPNVPEIRAGITYQEDKLKAILKNQLSPDRVEIKKANSVDQEERITYDPHGHTFRDGRPEIYISGRHHYLSNLSLEDAQSLLNEINESQVGELVKQFHKEI